MKTIMKLTYAAFAFLALAIGHSTANGATGDLIIPDSLGNIIQLPINPSFGTPSFVWNNENLPGHGWAGCAVDQVGNIYVSVEPGCVRCGSIYKVTPDRSTLTQFATGLYGPAGLAVDTAGNLYEADTGSGNIYKFTPEGVQSTFASVDFGGVSGNPVLHMVFDNQENLYVVSGQHEDPGQLPYVKVYKISPQGVVGTFVNLPNAFQAAVIAFDTADNLFVLAVNSYSSPFMRRLLKYTPNGAGPSIFGGCSDLNDFNCSIGGNGLVISGADKLYISMGATIAEYPLTYQFPGPVSSIDPGQIVPWWLRGPYYSYGQFVIQPPVYAAQVQPPINADGTSIFNARRGVISIRFALTYGGAATCTLPTAAIAVTRTAGGVTGQVNESVYTASADTGSNFRTNGCQYMYNLDSRALGVGSYRVDIKMFGGAIGSATFELR